MNSSLKLLGIIKNQPSLSLRFSRNIPLQSTNRNMEKMTNDSVVISSKQRELFKDTLPSFIDSLNDHPKFRELPEVGDWIKSVLKYTLKGGKLYRGLSTVHSYEMVAEPKNITEESLNHARILGWCVELLQAYFIVSDDIMDRAELRRGQPCWHCVPNVGLGAINDAILMYSTLFQILKKYFLDHPNYSLMVDLFQESIFYTSMGQHLDYYTGLREKTDYSLYTIDRYYAIVKHKTAYYTVKLPVMLGLLLANIRDENVFKKVEEISIELGKFFQIQDDYIDCYSDMSISGKTGTDIEEGKCSWLAVQALSRCNKNQKLVFKTCYGSKEPAHVERIKNLYDQLELPKLYAEVEKKMHDDIVKRANELGAHGIPPTLFLTLLNILFKRNH